MSYYDRVPKTISVLQNLEKYASSWVEAKRRLLLKMLEGNAILEVGCGTGTWSLWLRKQGFNVTGLDISEKCIEVARKKAKEAGIQAEFVVGDICRLSHDSSFDRFDSILLADVLEHVEHDDIALKNSWSLLKQDGVVVITVPALKLLYGYIDRLLGHYRRYSKNELKAKVISAGFKVVQIRFWNFLSLLPWLIYSRIIRRNLLAAGSLRKLGVVNNLSKYWWRIDEKVQILGVTLVVKARKI